MQPDPNDFAKQFEASMKAALKQLDATRAKLEREQNKLVKERTALERERQKIKDQAEKLAGEDFQKHTQSLEERMRREIYDEIIDKLLKFGIPDDTVQRWLGVSDEQMKRLRRHVGAEAGTFGVVRVHQDGRGGTIDYTHNLVHFTLHWEFGGGDCLALIFVPTEAHWAAQTGLPVEQRDDVLAHIAREVVRLQAQGHRWRVTENCIEILQ